MSKQQRRYWIAINGASCALSAIPFRGVPVVAPTPTMLIGFTSFKEAKEAQGICLHDPIGAVECWLRRWARSPDVQFVQPENPEPPTTGATMWMEAPA